MWTANITSKSISNSRYFVTILYSNTDSGESFEETTSTLSPENGWPALIIEDTLATRNEAAKQSDAKLEAIVLGKYMTVAEKLQLAEAMAAVDEGIEKE